jgi:cysteine desulfurase
MDPIYLDFAASTPVRGEVREAMEPYLDRYFGNPSSSHRWGREAQAALENARARLAQALGARRREIVFVRGGTESDNLAVLGRADAVRAAGGRPCVVTSAIEHKAVLEAARDVAGRGGEAVVVPVDSDGALDLDALSAALDREPCVVSVMWVNNEVGVIQPMAEVVRRAHERGAPVHTDAVQAVGKVPVRLDEVAVDCLSLSGHKIHGPKSAGALFVREGTDLHARVHGGGQEGGLRPGTQDVAGAVGLAEAVALAVAEQEETARRFERLRARLEAALVDRVPGLRVHARDGVRAPHILNVGVPDVSPEMLMISLDMEGLAVSGGSACASGSAAASHVLQAMYGPDALAASIRYSFGRATREGDVDRAAAITADVVARLRSSSRPVASPA